MYSCTMYGVKLRIRGKRSFEQPLHRVGFCFCSDKMAGSIPRKVGPRAGAGGFVWSSHVVAYTPPYVVSHIQAAINCAAFGTEAQHSLAQTTWMRLTTHLRQHCSVQQHAPEVQHWQWHHSAVCQSQHALHHNARLAAERQLRHVLAAGSAPSAAAHTRLRLCLR